MRATVAVTVLMLGGAGVASPQVPTEAAPAEPGRHRIEVTSTADSTIQPSYLIVPPGYRADAGPVPIVVSLHSWSANLEQRREDLEEAVAARGWLHLAPNFRGRNDHPEACGSDLAIQDVIDALDWVIRHYAVDERRVYLTGISGGGFMTLAMVTTHPARWTAASAWVPLTDLEAWYDFHAGDRYGAETRQCVGGDPRTDPAAKAELRRRSPLYRMDAARGVALDIAAGRFDGHDGAPIPVWHSLAAFNVLTRAHGAPVITAQEIAELSRHEPRLEDPLPGDRVVDESFGREIFLRRRAGPARVTIFEGGHEGLTAATIAWFEAHPVRP